MNLKLFKIGKKFIKEHKQWDKLMIGMLCVIVAFSMAYALMTPASTMEKSKYVLACSYDVHEHTKDCFEHYGKTDEKLICGKADVVVHTHDDTCYDADNKLVCKLKEVKAHEHTDKCYKEEKKLVCEQEESKGHEHTDACYKEEKGDLICDNTEETHEHTDACYKWNKVLKCDKKEGEGGHTHTDSCYQTDKVLTCDNIAVLHKHTKKCYDKNEHLICDKLEVLEHQHGDGCFKKAETTKEDQKDDVSTETKTEGKTSEVTTSTEAKEEKDKLDPAETTEEAKDSKSEEKPIEKTFKNDRIKAVVSYEKDANIPEDAEFKIEKIEVQNIDNSQSEKESHKYKMGFYSDEREIEPQGKVSVEVTFLSGEFKNAKGIEAIHYFDEDENTEVLKVETRTDENGHVVAKFEMNSFSVVEFRALAEDDVTTVAMPEIFHYETDNYTIAFHVQGDATLVKDKDSQDADASSEADDKTQETIKGETATDTKDEAANTAENVDENKEDVPELIVTQLKEDDEEYQKIAEYEKERENVGKLTNLSALSFEFQYQKQKLDVSNCKITADITPKQVLVKEAKDVYSDQKKGAASEAEIGLVLTAMQNIEDETLELDNVLLSGKSKKVPTLTVELSNSQNNGILAVTANETANPKFEVQYYAYLNEMDTKGNSSLEVIDTANGGTGKGGVLPKNGTTPTTKKIYLDQAGNVQTKSTLTEVYKAATGEEKYEYKNAPNLTYFNKLYENGNYSLKEIWILNEGFTSDSEEAEEKDEDGNWINWTKYSANIHFTNRPESVKNGTVLITDDTVIRLVYDATTSTYTNDVNFYDYDITDDGIHTSVNGVAQGINSPTNYTGKSGAKFAFGNANTGTKLQDQEWKDNLLNQFNSNGYKGCTFGLADSLNSNGTIKYSSGVAVPDLFNEGNANGKTTVSGKKLNFNRLGDTYTLSNVIGVNNAKDLQKFNHPGGYDYIWTNNFWPMDEVKGTDPKSGGSGNARGTYVSDGDTKNYPPSDDGIAHNNMFGMQYAVNFKLTKDYSGPLEYYFFGDDDMWVFLDGRLVCDIGGVHSSVGEYVNLWDYIDKGSSGTHTLSFFYTERGLSGSTCYMQFTLPSVSSVTPEQNTGSLQVQKKVTGAINQYHEEEFKFDIKLTDAEGKNLPDDYTYTRYDKNGNEVKKDLIVFDGGSFELKDGEYIIIKYLPLGTKYTITENGVESHYTVSNSVNGTRQDGNIATGDVGNTPNVIFTNRLAPMLPETGGPGTILFTIGGLLLISVSLMYRYKLRHKEGRFM